MKIQGVTPAVREEGAATGVQPTPDELVGMRVRDHAGLHSRDAKV